MLDMDILPKLNYVSMTWNGDSTNDSRSPADMTSVVSAVNAAAIKYLDDQQLVQQAVAAAGKRRHNSSHLARQQGQKAASSSNASVYGIKSANLSLASKKYFEKHRICNNPGVTEPQSVTPRRMSKTKMEDLMNSITSQVNGLQVLMTPRHSAQKSAVVYDADHHFVSSVPYSRTLSYISSGSSADNVTVQSLPMRQHDRV